MRGGAKARVSYDSMRLCISLLTSAMTKCGVYQTYTLPQELPIHRIRRIEDKNQWFRLESDLGPRCPEATNDYGRCHRPGHPVCYCSLYEDTALAEVDAEFGEQYAVMTRTISKDSIFLPIGEFDHFRRTGETYLGQEIQHSSNTYKQALARQDWTIPALIDAYLADEFMKPARNQMDYRVTSALIDVVLNDYYPRTSIDIIFYPSVAFRGGLNFAVLPGAWKSKTKLVSEETRVIEITDVLGYGIYKYKQVGILNSNTSNGELDWKRL